MLNRIKRLLTKKPMTRWDIINSFIQKHNYKSYLEIGYYKGWSFDQVNCGEKTAVDPNPCKTEEQQKALYGEQVGKSPFHLIFKLTSDTFFKNLRPVDQWDIIFIDGLHESTQVEKDIHNALKHLSPQGTIVLHDMNPPTLEHTTTGDKHGNWNGDCYKAFVKFQLQYPEYEAYTIDTDWGCGVIHNPPRDGGEIGWIDTWKDFKGVINDWGYFDRNRKSLLNLISVEEFKTKLDERTTDTDSTT